MCMGGGGGGTPAPAPLLPEAPRTPTVPAVSRGGTDVRRRMMGSQTILAGAAGQSAMAAPTVAKTLLGA